MLSLNTKFSIVKLSKNISALIILSSLVFSSPIAAFAAPRTAPFAPGQTLDPGLESIEPCGPSDANCYPVIPNASATTTGLLTNTAQTFGGDKVFSDYITLNGGLRDSLGATGTSGQLLTSNGTSTRWASFSTGAIASGTITSSTLYWNGSNWVENTNFLSDLASTTLLTKFNVAGTTTLATTTSTSLFANIFNSLLATITNLLFTNATGTNLSVTNLNTNNNLSSTGNTLTSNVGGSVGTSSIITNNNLTFASSTGIITTNINGVVSTTSLASLQGATGTQGIQGLTGLTGATGTVAVLTNIVSTTTNSFSTIVNGIASAITSFINSFTQTLSGNILTTNINGVIATSSVVGFNSLSFATSTGVLTSDINGVQASTTILGLSGINTGDVTLTGTGSYLTLAGQVLTKSFINLASDVSGILGITNGGTGANTAAGARTNLGAAASGSNSDITNLTALTSITLPTGSATTDSILDSTILLADLAGNSVNSSKIVDGSIVDADVATAANIALSKLADGSNIVTGLTAPLGSFANGGFISSNVLRLSFADSSNPGLVSTGSQTFAGNKVFLGNVFINSSLLMGGVAGTAGQVLTSGGTGVIPTWTTVTPNFITSIGSVSSTPNANGASVSSGVFTLQPADNTNPGVITTGAQTIAGDKTFNGNSQLNGLTANTTTINGLLTTNNVFNVNSGANFNDNLAMKNASGIFFFNTGTTFYTKLVAANNTANLTLKLPTADGTAGQVMKTDGAGNLSFVSAASGTSNTLTSAANILTSNVNGIIATSTAINSNVATSTSNSLTTIINGITSSIANIINSFTQTLSGNTLTTTINGVVATSSAISSNTLVYSTTTNKLISTINGVVSSTTIPGTENIVEFSVNANPNTGGTTFSPVQPSDSDVTYASTIDNSTWKWNGTTYVTYAAPASTAWFLGGTANDAGSNKTATISRVGSVRIGSTSTAANTFEITSTASSTSGLRFTNLLSTSATSTGNGKVLTVNANGDVILVDMVGSATTSGYSSTDIANLSTGGSIGSAASTVDIATNFNINQTTTLQTLTIPNPTNVTTTKGKVITINNVGTANFTIGGVQVPAGSYGSAFVWNGTIWNPINAASNVASEFGGNTTITDGQAIPTSAADVTGGSISLPSAGTWEVAYNVQVSNQSGTSNTNATLYITDSANTLVPNSNSTGNAQDLANSTIDTLSGRAIITVTGPSTYKLRARASAASQIIYNNSTIAPSISAGSSIITWQKISGNAAVTGQSVDYLMAKVGAFYNTNITTGDHIKYDNVITGNSSMLDTSTAYSSAANAASLGRFNLTAGKTYRLSADLGQLDYVACANNSRIGWWNADTGVAIAEQQVFTDLCDLDNGHSTVEAVYTPTTNTRVEVRIVSAGAGFIQIGRNAAGAVGLPTVIIQQLGSTAFTGVSFNSLTNAIASGALDNTNFGQSWNWSTATSTASSTGLLALSANSLTSGNLLSLDTRNASSSAAALSIFGTTAYRFGADYVPTTAHVNNVDLGNTSSVRVNSTLNAFLGMTGITSGIDGRSLTITNASTTQSFTIYNQSASSTATNRIITGTGADMTVAGDATLNLKYDAQSNRWRVVGGSGAGSTVSSVTLGNFATGGSIGTAAATVDTYSNIIVTQTTIGQALSLPNPTTLTAGKIVTVTNFGSAMFTMYTTQLSTSSPSAQFVWTGSAWNPVGGTANVAAEYGSNNSIANTSFGTTLVDVTGSPFTISSAGTWQVTFNVSARNDTTNALSSIGLYNSSNLLITGSSAGWQQDAAGVEQSVTRTVQVITTAAETFKLRGVTVSGTVTVRNLSATGIGQSVITWQKISGNAAVTGQSVDYVSATQATAQNPVVGAAINYTANVQGNVTSAGSGRYTLVAGKTYKLTANWAPVDNTSDIAEYQFFNVTAGAFFGQLGTGGDPANINSFGVNAEALITPTVNTNVEVRWTTDGATGSDITKSSLYIVQLGTSAVTGESIWGVGSNTFSDTLVKLFGSATNNAIAFVSSSTERMRILATGQINVGTTTVTTSSFFIQGTSTNPNVFTIASTTGNSMFNIANSGIITIGNSTSTQPWGAARDVLRIGQGGTLVGDNNPAQAARQYLALGANYYWDGVNDKSIAATSSVRFEMIDGQIKMQYATSSVANGNIVFRDAFVMDDSGLITFKNSIGNAQSKWQNNENDTFFVSRFNNRTGLYSSDQLTLGANGNGADQIILDNIGTLRPSTNGSQDLGATGNRWNTVFAANGTINTSDARLKENVLDLTNQDGLEAVLALRPVTYNWIDRSSGNQTNFGFLAQEVYDINPELVFGTTTGTSTLGINYTNFIPLLTKAVQELNNKVFGTSTMASLGIEELTASTTLSVDTKVKALGLNVKEVNDMLAQLASSTSATTTSTTTLDINGNSVTSTSTTFIGKLIDRVIAEVKTFLASATQVFIGKVETNEICIKKADGTNVCLNGEDLEKIKNSTSTTTVINNINNSSGSAGGQGDTNSVICNDPQVLNVTSNTCETLAPADDAAVPPTETLVEIVTPLTPSTESAELVTPPSEVVIAP